MSSFSDSEGFRIAEELKSMQKDNLRLRTEIERLNNQILEKSSENQKLQYQLMDSQKESKKIVTLEAEIDNLKHKLQIAANQISEQKEAFNREFSLDKMNHEHQMIQVNDKIKEKQSQIKGLESKIQQLNETITQNQQNQQQQMNIITSQNKDVLNAASVYFQIDFYDSNMLINHFKTSHNQQLLDKMRPDPQIEINKIKLEFEAEKQKFIKKISNIKLVHVKEVQKLQSNVEELNKNIVNIKNSNVKTIKASNRQIKQLQCELEEAKKLIPPTVRLTKFRSASIFIPMAPPPITQQAYNKVKDSNEELENKMQQLNEANRNNNSKIISLKASKKLIKRTKIELESKVSELTSKVNHMQIENTRLQNELSNKTHEQYQNRVIVAAKRKIQKQKNKITDLKQNVNELSNKLQLFQCNLDEALLIKSKLEAEIDAANGRIQRQVQQIDKLKLSQDSFGEHRQNDYSNKPTLINCSFPELPADLRAMVQPIAYDNSLNVNLKLQLIVNKICSYFENRIDRSHEMHRLHTKTEFQYFDDFLAELGLLTLSKSTRFDLVFDSLDIQSQIIRAIRKYKSTIKKLNENIDDMISRNPTIEKQEAEINRLNQKLRMAQIENSTIPDDYAEVIDSQAQTISKLKRRISELETKNYTNSISSNQIEQLHKVVDKLRKEKQDLQFKLAQSPRPCYSSTYDPPSEYDDLVQQLRKRCNEQRKTIQNLSHQICSNHP